MMKKSGLENNMQPIVDSTLDIEADQSLDEFKKSLTSKFGKVDFI